MQGGVQVQGLGFVIGSSRPRVLDEHVDWLFVRILSFILFYFSSIVFSGMRMTSTRGSNAHDCETRA